MSDQKPDASKMLMNLREQVASGTSLWGPVGSSKQVAKMAEIDAHLEFGRRIDEMPPAPPPMTADLVAQQELARRFPLGDPGDHVIPPSLVEHYHRQFDALGELDDARFGRVCAAVAQEIKDHTSQVSFRYSAYDTATGTYPSGNQIVEALLADATPAIEIFTKDNPSERERLLKLVRGDRRLLETFAAQGQAMGSYSATKKKFGAP